MATGAAKAPHDFRERESMSIISDLLRIRHFSTSNGSTVRKDFLSEVATALAVAGVAEMTKKQLIAACYEAAVREPMPPSLYSRGDTVTDDVLQAIINGIIENGVPGRVSALDPITGDVLPAVFDPGDPTNPRDQELIRVVLAQHADEFRARVVAAYRSRCAISGFDAVEGLELTRLTLDAGPALDQPSNALLLRSDLRRLFERGAIAVHEDDYRVLVRENIAQLACGLELAGRTLELPHVRDLRPSRAGLREHRLWAGL